MSARRKFAALCLCLAAAAARAQPPREAARQAMRTAAAQQQRAVAAMRLSIARQRAALALAAPSGSVPGEVPALDFTLSWPAPGPDCDPLPEKDLRELLGQAAKQEGVDAALLRAVAEQESAFRPCAVSPRGAMGLMQLMPETARTLGLEDPFDPRQNLLSGARFLKQLLARFGGDTALALGAYNAGPERVEESGGVPPIPETLRYVGRILSRLPIP